MKLKITALLLAALLVFSCLAGCGGEGSSSASSDADSSSSADNSSASGESESPAVDKYAAAYAKYSPDEIVLTVNGTEITWEEYFCWIYGMCTQLEYQYAYYYGIPVNWDEEVDTDYTIADNVFAYAEKMVSQYVVIDEAFAQSGLSLSEEDLAELESAFQSAIESSSSGSREAFIEMLKGLYITEEYYNYTSRISHYYTKLFEDRFGENGEKLPDEDAVAYLVDNGYMHARHILLKTVDDAGSPLEDSVVAEKLATAEDIASQLAACATTEEMLSLFTTLEAQYNEDGGLASYPDGYYFVEGEMVEAFENAVKALEENCVSGVVESPYGYHIVLRPAMNADDIMIGDSAGNSFTVRYYAANYIFDNIYSELFDSAEIVYTEKFENLSLTELLTAAE